MPVLWQHVFVITVCQKDNLITPVICVCSGFQQLRQEFEDRFYQGTFTWGDDLTPNDVAALMKQFLRELPSPLLTDEYIEAFAQVESKITIFIIYLLVIYPLNWMHSGHLK